MCDVTVDNFEEVLARIRAIVPTADFVSIDLEFTGLDHDHGDLSTPSLSKAGDGGCAAAGAAAGGGAGGGADLPAGELEAEPFDARAEAQTKYEKLCEATSFLVVQVSALLHVCPRLLTSCSTAVPLDIGHGCIHSCVPCMLHHRQERTDCNHRQRPLCQRGHRPCASLSIGDAIRC